MNKEEKINLKSELKEAYKILDEKFIISNTEICSKCYNRGCCKNCWESRGHFHTFYGSLRAKKEFSKLQSRFGWTIHGFWTKNGCRLPREYRSTTCLDYTCHRLRKYISDNERRTISNILEKIRNIRYKLNITLR